MTIVKKKIRNKGKELKVKIEIAIEKELAGGIKWSECYYGVASGNERKNYKMSIKSVLMLPNVNKN